MGGSSSHRRKSSRASRNGTRRNSPSRSITAPSTPAKRVLNFDHLQITQGIGFDLLKKSGWVPGEPLGNSPSSTPKASKSSPPLPQQSSSSSSSSSSTPIPIVIKQGRGGIGAPHQTLPDQKFFPNDSPVTPRSFPTRIPRRDDITGWQHDSSPDLVKQLANMEIYDPLRPRCQYDPTHVCRSLKALHKHEQNCPANPNRSRYDSFSTTVTNPMESFDGHRDPSANPFSSLPMDESFDDVSDYSSDHDNSSIMSSMSEYSDEDSSQDSLHQQNVFTTDHHLSQVDKPANMNDELQSAISTDHLGKLSS